ncbi:LssY C-terminal domain-containing protein [bacterium]|nr:LssY C-terminal domain-containing protein [bacterium]
MATLLMVMQACATAKPLPVDPLAYRNRTESSVNEDVTVTVAVPTISEAQAIYSVELSSKHIQPVWVEVKNDSADTYWFLPLGLDPEYFSPSEAAFAFHTDSDETNRQLDEKFQKLQIQNPVPPGSTEAGFVLVNLDEGFKAIDIDLISREAVKSFSFIMSDPEFRADFKLVDFETLYAADDIISIEDEKELRRVFEELPCCTNNADGDEYGDPLNLVLIGEINDIVPALVRRNWHATEIIWSQSILRTIKSFLKGERYRYSPISPLYVFGRPQDIGWQKARGTIHERNHMRFWLSPVRFRGKKVFVGQISRDIGVKLTLKSPTITTHVIDPDVDEARRYFVEDLAYSQALATIGYVKGVGIVNKKAPRMNLVGDPFYTDGFRAVLFFEPRPYTLSDIEMLEWEIPSGHYGFTKQE